MKNVTSKKSKYALYIRGYEHTPIRDIHIINCVFENASHPDVIENVVDLKIE
jgi:hypothetical protein